MNKQQDLFNPIQKDGHTAYWHRFYASTLRRVKKDKEEKELEHMEAQKPISININK